MSPQMISPDEALKRLWIDQGIEQKLNAIIDESRKLVDETKVTANLDKTQMSNLLGVALQTESARVVANYIRYQMGRDTKGTTWRAGEFGEKLATHLERLEEEAKAIAQDAAQQAADPPTQADIDRAWIGLVRQFVGQLNRYFVYKRTAEGREEAPK